MKYVTTIDTMKPKTVHIEYTYEDKRTASKTISYEDYKYIINNCEITSKTVRMGTVPQTFWDGFKNVDGEQLTGTFLFYVPKDKQVMSYVSENDRFMIPFPNLVFAYKVRLGRLISSKVYAVKQSKSRMSDNTELFHYPFGNVGTSGGICYGANTIPSIESLWNLEYMIDLFFSASTNNDLYSSSRTNLHMAQCELIRYVLEEMKDEFNDDILAPANMTVGNLFEN